jgi:hypothetical protein
MAVMARAVMLVGRLVAFVPARHGIQPRWQMLPACGIQRGSAWFNSVVRDRNGMRHNRGTQLWVNRNGVPDDRGTHLWINRSSKLRCAGGHDVWRGWRNPVLRG